MNVDEEELSKFKADALQVVKFILVFSEDDDDLNASNEKCKFSPSMAHQIFGDSEIIFGYEGLSVNLFYHHNSAKCFLDISYKNKTNLFEVDDITSMLNDYLPRHYLTSKEEYQLMIREDKHDHIFGTVIHEFKRNGEDYGFNKGETIDYTYKITQVDINDENFQEFHERFETFIIWFIDGANFLDLRDKRWMIFYIYEEFKTPEVPEKIVTPIGFTAIYRFYAYPESNRARISQFFILPTHQGKGFGTILYQTVYNKILNMPEITDITVEEPNENFQKMRDYCDGIHIIQDMEKNGGCMMRRPGKLLFSYFSKFKINKKQGARLADILAYAHLLKTKIRGKDIFEQSVYMRLKEQRNESSTAKRARRTVICIDPQKLNEETLRKESKCYVDELTPVASKISKFEVEEDID